MTFSKERFNIIESNEGTFIILVQRPRWIFFYQWTPLTYQEAEYSDEHILEFKSLQDAIEMINLLAK